MSSADLAVRGWAVFARIVQSGSCRTSSAAEAEQKGKRYAESLGCIDSSVPAECLRAKAADQLAAATEPFSFWPVTGGNLLPVEPQLAILSGAHHRVPLLLGNVREEAASFLPVYPVSADAYPILLASLLPNAPTDKVLLEYPATQYSDPFHALSATLSDTGDFSSIASCLTREIAASLSATQPTYVYEFDDPEATMPHYTSATGPEKGASHGTELTYLFDFADPSLDISGLGSPASPPQKELSSLMIHYWGAFAKNGNPNTRLAPNWPRFEPRRELVMQLKPGEVRVMADFAKQHHCAFWDAL